MTREARRLNPAVWSGQPPLTACGRRGPRERPVATSKSGPLRGKTCKYRAENRKSASGEVSGPGQARRLGRAPVYEAHRAVPGISGGKFVPPLSAGGVPCGRGSIPWAVRPRQRFSRVRSTRQPKGQQGWPMPILPLSQGICGAALLCLCTHLTQSLACRKMQRISHGSSRQQTTFYKFQ